MVHVALRVAALKAGDNARHRPFAAHLPRLHGDGPLALVHEILFVVIDLTHRIQRDVVAEALGDLGNRAPDVAVKAVIGNETQAVEQEYGVILIALLKLAYPRLPFGCVFELHGRAPGSTIGNAAW